MRTLSKDLMAMGYSDFDLDLIYIILGLLYDDRVAKNLSWIKQELDKDLKSFFDVV